MYNIYTILQRIQIIFQFYKLLHATKYVMRSSKMSPKLEKKNPPQFSFPMYASISELYYAETPINIECMVPEIISILVMLKTINYKGN